MHTLTDRPCENPFGHIKGDVGINDGSVVGDVGEMVFVGKVIGLREGTAEEGILLGAVDGVLVVGEYDGSNVGNIVGLSVGELDGVSGDGSALGIKDGSSDGIVLGSADGIVLGIVDGENVGLTVGEREGVSDDGAAVGGRDGGALYLGVKGLAGATDGTEVVGMTVG